MTRLSSSMLLLAPFALAACGADSDDSNGTGNLAGNVGNAASSGGASSAGGRGGAATAVGGATTTTPGGRSGTGGATTTTPGGRSGSGGAASTTIAGSGGSSGGKACGGIAGIACGTAQFCNYALAAMCGAADQMGTCAAMPEVCTAQYAPVCGCDAKTYSNGCVANSAGVSVASDGACNS